MTHIDNAQERFRRAQEQVQTKAGSRAVLYWFVFLVDWVAWVAWWATVVFPGNPLLGAKKFSLVHLNRHKKHKKLAGHGKCRMAENDFPCAFGLFAGSRPTEWITRREADIQEVCNGRGPSNLFMLFMLSVGNDLESVCVTHLTPSWITCSEGRQVLTVLCSFDLVAWLFLLAFFRLLASTLLQSAADCKHFFKRK